MRIPSGVTDQYIYFIAVDGTDLTTRETGFSSFTVYRSRNGGAAAAMTTPTINETDTTNMPGVYELLLDEDMTITSGNDSEAMVFHVTHAGMAPVTLESELYRPKITAGETLTVASGVGEGNAVQISGDTTAADNLELQYDTTGLTGDTFPATQAGVAAIGGGGPTGANVFSESYTLTTGTQSTGTISSVEQLGGGNHEHTDDAGVMDLYYEFDVGANSPISVTVTGYLNGANDDLEVDGYDWISASWKQIGILNGKDATTNEVNIYTLFTDMVGTGANHGLVRVRFTDGAFTLTSATLAVDQIFVSFCQGVSSYDGGSIWIDTTITNTNTVAYVDGTNANPVSTIAAANTLSANTNINQFRVAPGSTITFAAGQTNQTFVGAGWTLALGSQNIAGSVFAGATVSGTGTGSGPTFSDCDIGTATLADCTLTDCALTGTLTMSATSDYILDRCYAAASGGSAAVIDFGAAVANSNLAMSGWAGPLTINNKDGAGTDTMNLEGKGTLTVAASSGGAITINGNFAVTNTGGATITYDDNSTVITQQLTEAYAADGTAPTLTQALFLIQQMLTDFGIVGTTMTTRKIDGSTTAATFTLNDGTDPTDLTRAT